MRFCRILNVNDLLELKQILKVGTDENKKRRWDISKRNLEIFHCNPFLFYRRVVIMDETWVHHYDPETKRQSKNQNTWNEHRLRQ